MAKKKRGFVRPRRKLIIAAAVVLALGLVWITVWLVHNHAVTADRTRFAKAGNDVETVADQIVAVVGQPQDRRDGGKCSYAHQEFSKGPLSCEVYSYLAYGVNSPADVNVLVHKASAVPALNSQPWQFKAVTERPHQFVDGVNYSNDFVTLRNLFDTEVKTITYKGSSSLSCSVSFLYHNSLASVGGYPNFNVESNQSLVMDIDCAALAKAPYYNVEN